MREGELKRASSQHWERVGESSREHTIVQEREREREQNELAHQKRP
jgi:hypothetical protein